MARLQSRPAKVALIWLLSLLAAIVCFGFLHSSGAIANGAVELGGAFVGFVVSLSMLNRIWGQETSLEQKAEEAGSDFIYEEVVKVLDLRDADPAASDQVAPLTDFYRAKRLGDSSSLEMHYATTADGIDFEGSPTHPSADWQSAGVSHVGPKGERLKHEYVVNVSLAELAKGESTAIIHNLAYHNAFKQLPEEWLETHLEHPTGTLTVIVLAPDKMQFTSSEGTLSLARDHSKRTARQPAVMQDGSVIYWSVTAPVLSSRYAVSWGWKPRE